MDKFIFSKIRLRILYPENLQATFPVPAVKVVFILLDALKTRVKGPGQKYLAILMAFGFISEAIFCKKEMSGMIKGKGLFKSLPFISNIF